VWLFGRRSKSAGAGLAYVRYARTVTQKRAAAAVCGLTHYVSVVMRLPILLLLQCNLLSAQQQTEYASHLGQLAKPHFWQLHSNIFWQIFG